MPFLPDVKREALVAAQRCCCICHVQCGVNIECAHIVAEADGGPNILENCIPLCFNHHGDVGHYNPKHPKGNKFTPEELRQHRDKWFAQVSKSQFAGNDAEMTEIDRQVFGELRELLPSDGPPVRFKNSDFIGEVAPETIDQLDRFVSWASLPENEFLNADLNSLMAELITVTSQLPMALFELELVKESPADSRDQFDEAIFKKRQEIFDIFTRMREVYFSLIRTGRRKFSVR